MKAIKTMLATSLVAIAMPSFASPSPASFELQLTFETAPADKPVLVGKPRADIAFSNTAWMAAGSEAGIDAWGNFFGPGPEANLGALTLASDPNGTSPGTPPATMFSITVEDGFNGSFYLRFGGFAATSIAAFNKAGEHLQQFDISAAANNSNGSCTNNAICNWTDMEMTLGDTAVYKIVVSGADGLQWFDNISFGNFLADDGPGGNVPEPSGIALSLAALGALCWTRRRIAR